MKSPLTNYFIPQNIEAYIKSEYASRERYDKQKINFNVSNIEETELQNLIQVIEREKKGLDQEYFIVKTE